MWSDNETTTDLLGFRVHAELIGTLVLRPDLLPLTIGVFGDWGSGKTSIMQMLQHSLDPANTTDGGERERLEHVAVLYFNGWIFEGYDDAKAALISTILKQLAEHQRFGPKIRLKVGSLWETVDKMRLAKVAVKDVGVPLLAALLSHGATVPGHLLGLANRFLPKHEDEKTDSEPDKDDKEEDDKDKEKADKSKEDKDDWSKLIKKTEKSALPDVRSFREQFSALLKGSDIKTLVVLIDDLDRCSPGRILDNLEAIKLFLNVENTAFVIGADPRIVRHAILTRYPPADFQADEGGTNVALTLATDYLEKLIQVPYRLPRLSPAEVETYMALLFCHRDLVEGDLCSKVLVACDQQRSENRYSVFGYAAIEKALQPNGLSQPLGNSLAFCAKAAPLITEGLNGNPRQVKRFLNAFTLRKELARVAKLENIRDDVLVKLMLLEYGQHEKQFVQLARWQEAKNGYPDEIRALENVIKDAEISEDDAKKIIPEWSGSFMRRWTAMEPHISDVDLRDYFWIARDRLDASFSASSLIPPFLRRILEELLANDATRERGATAALELSEDEKVILLANLGQHLIRRQDDPNGYSAFRALLQKKVPGVASTYAAQLLKCIPQSVPANIPLDLNTLSGDSEENRTAFSPVLSHWAKTDTSVGRAAKTVLANERKDK